MQRPTLIWLDMTLATQHAEIDAVLLKYFDVLPCTNIKSPETEFDFDTGLGICFEFDYPDRPGLELMLATKERLPHVPLLMVTTHHSEKLAVWAYRNRVFDYLVKPIRDDDVSRCYNLLSAIQNIDTQRKRPILRFPSQMPTEIPAEQRSSHKRLLPALRYVEQNFRGKIRNAEVSALCDMSQYHFSHEFGDTFSLTFQEYVLRYRILEACKELCHPNVPVANVAYSVGFNDPSYFARVFRRYLGCSPSEFSDSGVGPNFKQKIEQIAKDLELVDLESECVDRIRAKRSTLDSIQPSGLG